MMSHVTWRHGVILGIALLLCAPAPSKEKQVATPWPDQFEIGRRTFFDFGPPFDFYELLLIRPVTQGSSIERVTLTPPGDECIAPAKLEVASASIDKEPAALLGGTNPCTIPEKELSRELKRCKHCLVFSGAQVVMQFRCGSQTRLIRSDILDRDLFDAAAKTPEHASWTMALLARLEHAIGPGVMDRPVFPTAQRQEPSTTSLDSSVLEDLSTGKYDVLFPVGTTKASQLYSTAQNHPAGPTIRLVSSVPYAPIVFIQPDYPPLAKLAHIKGAVSFTTEVDANDNATNLVFKSGHPILQAAVKNVVSGWKFPNDAENHFVEATIEFGMNCTTQP